MVEKGKVKSQPDGIAQAYQAGCALTGRMADYFFNELPMTAQYKKYVPGIYKAAHPRFNMVVAIMDNPHDANIVAEAWLAESTDSRVSLATTLDSDFFRIDYRPATGGTYVLEKHRWNEFNREYRAGSFGGQRYGQAFYDYFKLHRMAVKYQFDALYEETDAKKARNLILQQFVFM